MKRLATVFCLLAVAGIARADDKPNPTGTWKYTAAEPTRMTDVAAAIWPMSTVGAVLATPGVKWCSAIQ